MNILVPDSWLKEYLDTKATPQQIKDCLSLCGPSVEKVTKVGDDVVYEMEITTNRVDMASIYGIAREAAAILPRFGIKAELKPLIIKSPPKSQDILPMQVSDPKKICSRIMGIVMEVNEMKDSPGYVKERLEKSGVRSLNNLVDITNYVMLELGHPCHVFDYDRIKTHKFLIRFAKKNEPIVTLDYKKYLLSDEDVIIDDGTGRVIDLPGIMGTENSVVTKSTRRIFFFIESNNPVYIRRTSMRYAIRTMAASINEKHPDPELVKTALLRGIDLYQKLAGGKVAGDIIDIYPNKTKPQKISVSTEFINERLGIKLIKEEVVNILKSLNFNVILNEVKNPLRNSKNLRDPSPPAQDDILMVTPPTYRQFDITIPEDIVEEVARIYGYHNLPGRLMTGEIPVSDRPKILSVESKIKEILKYWGYTEIYNYSFISKDTIGKSKLKLSDHLRVANPLTADIEHMRISLVPSMLETIVKNQPYSDNLNLFELANVYQPRKGELPDEYAMLTLTDQKDFYRLKGVIVSLLKELGISDLVEKPEVSADSTWPHFWHPKQTLTLQKDGKSIAIIGKIHPSISQNFQLKNDLYLAVLNVQMTTEMTNPAKKYTPIPTYPAVIEDITISFPPQTYIGPAIAEIYKVSPLIRNIEIVDTYKDTITQRITFQDKTKNLESEDVKRIREQILQILFTKYKIKI